MNELKIAEVKGLRDIKVFQVNECDTVAAYSLSEAKEAYKRITGMDDEEAFYDFEAEERSLDERIWDDEDRKSKSSMREIINQHWNGEPFIVCSTAI